MPEYALAACLRWRIICPGLGSVFSASPGALGLACARVGLPVTLSSGGQSSQLSQLSIPGVQGSVLTGGAVDSVGSRPGAALRRQYVCSACVRADGMSGTWNPVQFQMQQVRLNSIVGSPVCGVSAVCGSL